MDNNDWGRLQELALTRSTNSLRNSGVFLKRSLNFISGLFVILEDFMAIAFRDKDVKKMMPKLKNNNKQYEDLINKKLRRGL